MDKVQEFGDQVEAVIDELHELESAIEEMVSMATDLRHEITSLFSIIRNHDGEVHEVELDSELDTIEGIMSDISYDTNIERAVNRVRDAKSELDDLAGELDEEE